MAILNQVLTLISTIVGAGGAALGLWGAVTLGSALPNHDGPGITNGFWRLVGGALIITAAVLFTKISF